MRFYDSLDELPIHNWWKLNESGDLRYLLLNKVSISISNDPELIKVLERLNDQYISLYGTNDEFKLLIELKADYVEARANAIINKDLDQEMKADLLGLRIKSLEPKEGEGIENHELVNIIETNKGFRIDTKNISVTEFHNTLNFIIKENGKNKDK